VGVRFGTGDAADGWEELCRHALANTRRCLQTLRADPRSGRDTTASTGSAATWPPTGTTAAIWSSGSTSVTSGGRVRYAIDDGNRTVWLIYASPRHPKDTDR
jgi:hypothetical protein